MLISFKMAASINFEVCDVIKFLNLSNDALTQLLLYGDNDLSNNLNRSILELTLSFIHETGRFD